MPTWFITGCSTGLGRELAKAVLGRGWNAVVTARNQATLAHYTRGYEKTALTLALDVTNKAQIADAVKAAEARFGGIDVLVNNAGYGYRAALEEGDDSEVRRLFDANVFGVIDVTKAVLPVMRKQRRGHVVNISSSLSRTAVAGGAYYTATKAAVNGISYGLARETAPLGIKVTIIEPGTFRTEFSGRALNAMNAIDDYAETAGKARINSISRQGKQSGDPAKAAEAIIKAVEAENPPLHLLLGPATLDLIRSELQARLRELDEWAETTKGTDFPSA
jgi:NAD(P)-dependent dehydrogenase (short-subunit alcohol dehydrogenase family)